MQRLEIDAANLPEWFISFSISFSVENLRCLAAWEDEKGKKYMVGTLEHRYRTKLAEQVRNITKLNPSFLLVLFQRESLGRDARNAFLRCFERVLPYIYV